MTTLDTKYKMIELQFMEGHPANFPGRELDTVELERSIEKNGLMQPLTVRLLEGGESYQILAGHRRFAAMTAIGETVAPCIVRDLDDVAALDFVLLENMQRNELDPMDEAYAVKLLLEQHANAEEVAELLSRSKVWVNLRQGLLELGVEAQEKVKDGELSLGAAAVILKCEEQDRAQAEELVLFPDFQMEPLNARQAEEVVKKTILEPAAARAEWENKRGDVAWEARSVLRDDYEKRVEGLNVQAAKFEDIEMYQSADFVNVREEVPKSVITKHAPSPEHLGMLCGADYDFLRWVDLAQRHGLAVTVVPFNERFHAVVSKKILVDAEKSRMEHGLEPWIDESTKADSEEKGESEEDKGSADEAGNDALDATDPAEKLGETEALAKELEWFIERSRETAMREKVELGAAVNYVLGVSEDCPVGFENLVHEDMSPGARKMLLRTLCWCQGVDFWK